ncbi:chemotaxis protein CheC [Oceanobacillus sp. CAU 1775]
MGFKKLTEVHVDVLRELGNIGAGNAATSLSQLLQKKIDMIVPSVNIVSFDEMVELFGDPDDIIVAILFRIYGDAPSTVIFILTVEEAESLIQDMVGDTDFDLLEDSSKNPLALSALEEVGNILTGSYIAALSDLTGLHLQQSVPHLGIDMAAAVLTYGLLELSQSSDYAIVIDSKVNADESKEAMTGNFFLLPNPEAIPVILKALGINGHE